MWRAAPASPRNPGRRRNDRAFDARSDDFSSLVLVVARVCHGAALLVLLRSSWPRLLDLIYWPTVQMCMWGLLQTYIGQQSGSLARAGQTFLGAVILWDILFRGQLGFSLSFLEEMYSRNLSNLMISPLRRRSSSHR